MASKPRSEWTETYRRRVERAEAAGKTRQQARGHVVKEHIRRRERERANKASAATVRQARDRQEAERKAKPTATLSPADKAYARRIGRELCKRAANNDPDKAAQQALNDMRRMGPDKFRAEVKLQRDARAKHKQRTADGRYEPFMDEDYLKRLSESGGFTDFHWYFYH